MTRRERNLILILLVGLSAAGAAYVAAPVETDDPELREEVRDVLRSRRYERDLERIGGKANLLVSDLDAWLSSLWQGTARAYTLAALTAFVATAYALATRGGGRPDPPDRRA